MNKVDSDIYYSVDFVFAFFVFIFEMLQWCNNV